MKADMKSSTRVTKALSGPRPRPVRDRRATSAPTPASPQRRRARRPLLPTSPVWDEVGPGWQLALVRPDDPAAAVGPRSRAAASRRYAGVYMIDPSGRRTITLAPLPLVAGQHLAAWSGDARRALLCHGCDGAKVVREVDLATGGALNEFEVAEGASISYTRPRGLALLIEERGSVTWVDVDPSRRSTGGHDVATGRLIGTVLQFDDQPPTDVGIDADLLRSSGDLIRYAVDE